MFDVGIETKVQAQALDPALRKRVRYARLGALVGGLICAGVAAFLTLFVSIRVAAIVLVFAGSQLLFALLHSPSDAARANYRRGAELERFSEDR